MLLGDPAERECVPLWPHAKYAEAFAAARPPGGYAPKVIELDAFLERWLPGMQHDNRFLAVFPTPSNVGIVVEPARARVELDEERARIE